ncbi:MAG: DUF1178 domain-containing protein [Deltaproteobacteria bacterium]|nr:MAG: DUF1178 domain-containing protein [Deltaproteobacteria bacterium]
MIAYDLECSQGHIFEGWFDSLESFEAQNADRMICCPYCEDTEIRRILSPVALMQSDGETGPAAPSPIDYQRLAREVVTYIRNHSEDVGPKFAAEALKMHYGVAEKRNIRGTATSEEEKTLREEGIEFFKFPLPDINDKKKN